MELLLAATRMPTLPVPQKEQVPRRSIVILERLARVIGHLPATAVSLALSCAVCGWIALRRIVARAWQVRLLWTASHSSHTLTMDLRWLLREDRRCTLRRPNKFL